GRPGAAVGRPPPPAPGRPAGGGTGPEELRAALLPCLDGRRASGASRRAARKRAQARSGERAERCAFDGADSRAPRRRHVPADIEEILPVEALGVEDAPLLLAGLAACEVEAA